MRPGHGRRGVRQLAMANLPGEGGTVDLVNHPADQMDRDGKLPENQ